MVLMGGPPCQGFSRANQQTRDHRNPHNAHVYTFIDYVKQLRPLFFLMENVLGLQVFEQGRVLKDVFRLLGNAGYSVDMGILSPGYAAPERFRYFSGLR